MGGATWGETSSRPAPLVTPENAHFWTGGAYGKLQIQRCEACGWHHHPPKSRCSECLSEKIQVQALSGRGVVVARTTNHQMWHPEFPPPYVIAIVELEEASYVRLTTRIVNADPKDVVIGSRVRVVFERQGPAWIPLFELEAA